MFTIRGGLAERLGFGSFSINLDTATLNDGNYSSSSTVSGVESYGLHDNELENADIVFINPRAARKK